jgi:hypothetical protein
VCFLDADDWWTAPDKVACQLDVLESGGADVVGAFVTYHAVDAKGKPTQSHGVVPPVPGGMLRDAVDFAACNPMLNCTVMLSRELALLDDTGLSRSCTDYALWLRLRREGKRFCNVPRVLAAHRLHAGSVYNTCAEQPTRVTALAKLHRALQVKGRVVVVELMGGTGNWLFQAAHGFAFAHMHQADLVLHDVLSVHGVSRVGLLANFTFVDKAVGCIPHDVLMSETPEIIRSGQGLLRRDWPDACGAVRLFGYFQVVPALSTLLGRFINMLQFSAEEQTDAALVVPNPEVSAFVHVRRGDYLHAANVDLFHRVSTAYFEACVQRLPACCEVVMFTDDVEWAKDQPWNVAPRKLVVAPSSLSPNATLAAMARCRFAVLSNSTFGVWGALLARHTHAVHVQAPVEWLSGDRKPTLPMDWVPVDNLTGAVRC